MGKIPAIDHDGFRLADSSAILDYIEHLSPQPALIPADARGAARARWFDKFGEVELDRKLSVVFTERFLKPRLFKVPGDEALAQQALDTHLPPLFDYLESQISGPFLVGGAFGSATSRSRRRSTISGSRRSRSMRRAGRSSPAGWP